jgi:hypothetical protein
VARPSENAVSRPVLTLLRIADPPEAWAALGFHVQDTVLDLGGVRIELGADTGTGIVSWGLHGLDAPDSIDGLLTAAAPLRAHPEAAAHPNGALGIDHVVITTPDFGRTAGALADAGLELRRTRESDRGRQGFRRLGATILELVEVPGTEDPSAPARFWGLVVVVADLEALARRLGSQLGSARAAVQPGRQIATLRSSAGVAPAVAFMTPEPEAP